MFGILPAALSTLLATLFGPISHDQTEPPLRFQLRHVHAAATNDSRIIFADVPPSFAAKTYQIPTRNVKTYVPESQMAFLSARSRSLRFMQSQALIWQHQNVDGPNVEKRQTLLELAKMTYDSYSPPGGSDWYEVGSGWGTNHPFGWEPDADGFRGHIFATEDNSTVVISVKGTSPGWMVGGGGPTVGKDKLNDNILFSCCCARVSPTWSTVCDCHSGGSRCDQDCLEDSLQDESLFYHVGTNLFNNVTYIYPNANIWITGHSLGGGLSSLLGVTFGVPVVAFEAPGEKLAARRLHLPPPPSTQHITHVVNNADPIPAGACTGITSACGVGGYALETSCHLGKVINYDTVGKLKWSVSVSYHMIKIIIDQMLNEDWDPKNGREVPIGEEQEDCVDCFNWEFGNYKNFARPLH